MPEEKAIKFEENEEEKRVNKEDRKATKEMKRPGWFFVWVV
jgi:hypothetical protein